MQPRSRKSGRFWLITGLMAASFLAGSWVAPRIRVEWEPGRLPNQAFAQTPRQAVGPDEPVARAVEAVGPSVVNIDTVKRVIREDFFGDRHAYDVGGAGSGVVIDRRGYVLTNEHVVAGADRITLTFGNGRKYDGKVLGVDHETDVGLIQIINPPANLPVAQLGDSRALVPGQWAIAIGNPYGYQQTVTLGVIGHTGRAVQVDDRVYQRLIQTDAAINPGNSGGPLVDIHGRVVGINTIVRSDAQGIGFAIPIHLAKGIADELIRSGKIKRPWTGLITEPATDYMGPDEPEGLLITKMYRRGPGWQAGIRPGDILRELAGRKIRTQRDFDTTVAGLKIGQKVDILVERDGQRLKGELTIGERP
ncbi:MAG TPA: trypsin-like peptidase domain-containing protein [Armatimonadota bacterium]|nr:trypsin-like peptidase domain-containing protein [Armatimonadota bacterium]